MKKTILIVGLIAVVVMALGVLGVGVAFAQDTQPPVGSGMMGGRGLMRDYVEKALSDKLGIAEADIESALDSGKTMYQIALDNGITETDIPAFLTEVHTAAFEKAVENGIITREQADFMLQRMAGRGYGTGNCPMQNGQGGQYGGGNGYRGGMNGNSQFGHGMMGHWQQVPPTAQP
jgi:hypothetical protein